MTATRVMPLSIDGAAEAAGCSRSTIERGLRTYRNSDGSAGLRHGHRPRGRRYASDQSSTVVEIDPDDLRRWLDDKPPAAGTPVVSAVAA